jgi:hypothetical protein
MSHYSKIERMTSNDSKFNQLSDDAKLTFFILLTHPHLTSLGAMRGSFAGLASEMGWSGEKFKGAMTELVTMGMVQADESAHFVWFPHFLKHNQPESPNVVKSWSKSLNYLPECALKQSLLRHVKAFVDKLPRPFQAALPSIFLLPSERLSEGSLVEPLVPVLSLSEGSSPEPVAPVVSLSEGSSGEPLISVTSLSEGNVAAPQASVKSLRESVTVAVTETVTEAVAVTEAVTVELGEIKRKEQEDKSGVLKHIVAPARPEGIASTEVLFVFTVWKTTFGHPQAMLDDKRKRVIRQALKLGYSVDQLCQAITGCSLTPHNMGKNDRGQRFDGLHVILKDAHQIERFIRNAQSPPRERNAADALIDSNLAVCQEWIRDKHVQQAQEEKTYAAQ